MNHVVVGELQHITGDDRWTWAQGQGHGCSAVPTGILGTPSSECHPPLPPQPPCTFLAPPHGILLPQGDLHVEGVAVIPERDPGRVLQRFGTAAAVAPLVRAGGTCGAHGALGVLGGAQGVGVPQHIGAPSPGGMHTEVHNVPGGMLSPILVAPQPGPPRVPPFPPTGTCSQLADAALQLGVAAGRAPAPVRVHVGAASDLLGLPVLPVGVEHVLLRQPRVAPASLQNQGEEKLGGCRDPWGPPTSAACPPPSPRRWPSRSRAEPAGC